MDAVSEDQEILGPISSKSARVRGGKKAVLRFGLTLSRSTLDKAHVFEGVKSLCEACVVSEEVHADGDGKHYHAYLQLRDPQTVVQTRESVELALFGDIGVTDMSIHLDTLRNEKHWIKYITKEDVSPMYDNVDSGMFHQSWKIHDYIANNEVFDPMHAFCRQNPSLINILRRSHTSYWDKKYMTVMQNEILDSLYVPNWRIHWVRCVDMFLRNGRNIYLHGHSGMGKTTLINYLCGSRTGYVPLGCRNDAFEWSDVEPHSRYLVAGDAPAGYMAHHRSTLLKLCDKTLVSVNVKCGALKRVLFRGQIIVVSNFHPDFLPDGALFRRFAIVHADENGVQEKIKAEPEVLSSDDEGSIPDTPIWIASSSDDGE